MKIRTGLKAGGGYGSFEDSCDHEYVNVQDGQVVINAWCKDGYGGKQPASIVIPDGYTGDVANCNGTLVLGSCQ
jgi:hypothetical protein